MNFPFLASFIIFILVIGRAMRKHTRAQEAEKKSFWARERQANHVRRKALDNLDYIKIPLDALPLDILSQDDNVRECVTIVKELAGQPIVNLTGWSNTDLKLEYGTANLTPLSEYDQRYTLLVCTLQKWAELLYRENFIEEAKAILEFAVSTRTDVGKSYYLLADIYTAQGQTGRIPELTETAKSLRSLSRNAIVRTLQESYPCSG